MIEAVIFDLDGTLIDSVEEHALAWTAGFRDNGVDVDLDAMRRLVGKGADQVLPLFLDSDQVKGLGKAIDARQHEIFREQFLPNIHPFPAVRALFERLTADGIKCVLASSAKPPDAKQYLQIAGITDLANAVATAEDAEHSKPSPDIVTAALNRIAPTKADHCRFVGDTPYDAEAAKQAGVTPIGVLTGVFSESELREAGCVAVYRDVEALLEQYAALVSR